MCGWPACAWNDINWDDSLENQLWSPPNNWHQQKVDEMEIFSLTLCFRAGVCVICVFVCGAKGGSVFFCVAHKLYSAEASTEGEEGVSESGLEALVGLLPSRAFLGNQPV